jgi:hypothetical protein
MTRMISTPAKRLPITSRIALLSAFGRHVLSVLLVLACMLNGALAQAQGKAPVEDRTPNRDALLDGQQRLDFARQYWRRAADDAGRAQAEAWAKRVSAPPRSKPSKANSTSGRKATPAAPARDRKSSTADSSVWVSASGASAGRPAAVRRPPSRSRPW